MNTRGFGSIRIGVGVLLTLAMMLVVPHVAYPASSAKKVIKVAVNFPRSQKAAIQTKIYNKRIAKMTDNEVEFRVYWGGAAGDERAVLRKMKTGQIDASPFGLEILSSFVREALVLQSPGLFMNYKQVDAVRAALTPQFDKEAYENGFKILGWGDIGRLRLFSKHHVVTPSDFKKVRPWLYTESETLKALYRIIGATGVPLGIAEVYGGMETGMIDTFWGTSVIATALQWHRTAKYVSGQPLGFVSGAFALRREAWDGLSQKAKDAIHEIATEQAADLQQDMRDTDETAFKKLLDRGYTAIYAKPNEVDQWWAVGSKLRQQMVGRIYSAALVKQAEQIALKYADKDQRERFDRMGVQVSN